MDRIERRQRALGALYGLAIGDALGMPTQSFSPETISERYGLFLQGFEPGPSDQPLAPGLPAGRTTDDTAQALIVADLLIEGDGQVDPTALAQRLMAYEDEMRSVGSLDLLGPSTKRAVSDLLAGTPIEQTGLQGSTNGGAMRISPVGIAFPVGPRLIDAVVQACRVTHFTSVALSGAAAVATAVSAGIDGVGARDVLPAVLDAGAKASRRGVWAAGADVGVRLQILASWVHGRVFTDIRGFMDNVAAYAGTSLATQESVVAAFACAMAFDDDPWLGVRVAASLGGDCDTIAAMTGAILGACAGLDAFPVKARDRVTEINQLDLEPVADALLALRDRDPYPGGR